MNFIFFGTPKFAVFVLDELLRRGLKPALIVAAPDKPAGRGLKLMPPPAKTWAESRGIPVLQPNKPDGDFLRRLQTAKHDLFLVAAYGKIIPKSILNLASRGALNIHPSLLPRWRGADPIRAAILSGDQKTGVTLMRMDEQMDHGPVLEQHEIIIAKKTYEELEKELAAAGAELFAETLPKWLEGKIVPQEQTHAEATFTKKITKEDGKLNWNEPAEIVARKIRALNPWPGTYTFWKRADKILRVRILAGTPILKTAEAGAVFKENSEFAIGCRDGAILVKTLQLEGKKPQPSAEFAKGYPEILRAILA